MTPILFEYTGVQRSATLSECGTYLYELRRTWDSRPPDGWIMLNPSTASAEVDDATIRKCMAYARAWGHGGIVVRNLYALRATDPAVLRTHHAPFGPDNYRYLADAANDPITVCGWGNNADQGDVHFLLGQFQTWGLNLAALAVTKSGQPVHPLYQRGDLLPQEYPRKEPRS